jgi:hypothetical protein
MRNYWLRIVVGAVAIFSVGMIGVTLARQGAGRVRSVVEGTGPLSLPIAFVPFKLDGQKLGTVSKIVLQRDAPKRISSVQVQIKLGDSVLARGLAGCRLLANFEQDRGSRGDIKVRVGPRSPSVFSCVQGKDSVNGYQRFGDAVFEPGGVSVPLLLPDDIVNDLKEGNFGSDSNDSVADSAEAKADSIEGAEQDRADSVVEAVQDRADSIAAVAEKAAKKAVAQQLRLADSLRKEGLRRQDSSLRAAPARPDSARHR